MAPSQSTAAATSGRYMSDFGKSVSPALKLMKVLTTATDASEMPIAAGIPSSRTRPDVCRMNSRVDSVLVAPAGTDASLLVTGLPPATAPPGRGMPKPGRQDHLPAQMAPQADLMVRPGQEIVNTYEHIGDKSPAHAGKSYRAAPKGDGVLFGHHFRFAVTMR